MPPTATSAHGCLEQRAQHHGALVICSHSQGSLQITASQAAPSHYIILPIIVVAQRYELCFLQTITKIILFCSLSKPSLPTCIPCSLPSFALHLLRAQHGVFLACPRYHRHVILWGSDHSSRAASPLSPVPDGCSARLLLPPSSLSTFCELFQLIGAPVSSTVCAAPQHTAKGYPLSSPVH